ncbi:MAG: APC family permease [Promethearchaeota archaeon]|nr:MAG: APC family permease [Candidatus Lokiarchaeota archaeon]
MKLTEKEEKKILPTRNVGLLTGILYGIGCGIGGSIFILLGEAIYKAQSGVLISLILGGILIFITALNYSELSTSLPVSGGAYNFSKEALGGFLAFIIGFFLWIANIATFSFSTQAFSVVIEAFFPLPFVKYLFIPITIILILFTAIVVFRTQKLALRTLVYLTIILLIIFGIFIFSGIFIAPTTNISGYDPSFLLADINFFYVITMFSTLFIFFTSITSNIAYLNADIKNPSKNIPKTNIFAILITLLIYLSMTIVVLINIGSNTAGLDESPLLLTLVMNDILGFPGYLLMGIAAAISTFIAMNAALGSAVAVMYALARDHYISKRFLKVSKKRKVPTLVILVTTAIAILFTILAIIYANIGFTANITTFIYFFGLAFVNFAAVLLRYKRKELDRPFKAPFFPYLPIIVGTSCLILAFVLSATNINAVILGLIFLFIGVIYYFLTITDRHSITLTLAGLKFFAILLVGIFIWVINNLSSVSSTIDGFTSIFSYVLLRILIFFCIFIIGTIFFDIIPLKEVVYFFIRRINKAEVAIDIGIGRIIELKKSKARLIYYTNNIIDIVQISCSIFIFILVSLFTMDILSIDTITFGNIVVSQKTSEFLFLAILIFLSTILLFSGSFSLYLNKETKTLGI